MTTSEDGAFGALERIFPGDSEMAGRMRAFDWSKTDLGPPAGWPENLRLAVSLCLTSRFPIILWWGPNFAVLYNDAYIPFLGEKKHPRVLGLLGRECWGEIWDTIGPMLEGVRATGTATWSEDALYFFARNLPREEVYVRYTYGPILSGDGRTVEGIFCPCTETTEQVVAARRLETLRKLAAKAPEARSVAAACREAARVLAEGSRDIPFAAVYVVDETGTQATLAATAGGEIDTEFRVTWPDGSVHWLTDRGKAFPGPDGRPLFLTGASTDITDRKRLEEELREADRRKNEFLAMLGHELRNPLAPLRGVMETLQRQQLEGPALERAYAMMDRQVAHLSRLVDDLLDVSRITRGLVELRKEPVYLAGAVDRAVEMVTPAIEGRGHDLNKPWCASATTAPA
jgi:PAS domain-containing protein